MEVCELLTREMKRSCRSMEEVRQRLESAVGDRPSKRLFVEFFTYELGLTEGEEIYEILVAAAGRDQRLSVARILEGIRATWGAKPGSSQAAHDFSDCSPSRMDAHLDHVARQGLARRMEEERRALSIGGFGVRGPKRCVGTPKSAAVYGSSFLAEGMSPVRGREASLARSASIASRQQGAASKSKMRTREVVSRSLTPTRGGASSRSLTPTRGGTSSRSLTPIGGESNSPPRRKRLSDPGIFDRLHASHAAKLQSWEKTKEERAKKEVEEADALASRTVKKTRNKPEKVAERVWNASIEHRERQNQRVVKDRREHRRYLEENDIARNQSRVAEEELEMIIGRLHGDRARIDGKRKKEVEEKEKREQAELDRYDVCHLHRTPEEAAAIDPEQVVDRILTMSKVGKSRMDRKRQQMENHKEQERVQELADVQRRIEYESVHLRHIADPTMKRSEKDWEQFKKRMDDAEQRSKARKEQQQVDHDRHLEQLRATTAPNTPRSPGDAAWHANRLFEDADSRRENRRLMEDALRMQEQDELLSKSVHRHAEGDESIFQVLYEDASRKKRVLQSDEAAQQPSLKSPAMAPTVKATTMPATRKRTPKGRRDDEDGGRDAKSQTQPVSLQSAPPAEKSTSHSEPSLDGRRRLVVHHEGSRTETRPAVKELPDCLGIARMLEGGMKQWNDDGSRSKSPRNGRVQSPQSAPRRAG